jgi:DNA-nicking Smr family endonuclease
MADRRRPDDALSEEERRLFEEEMRGVRRIERESAHVVPRTAPLPPLARRPPEPVTLRVERTGDHVSAFHDSVSATVRRGLRQGQRPIEATLDLHGARASAVAERLERFVHAARAANRRCVRIVTGRGLRSGPVGPVVREAAIAALTEGPLASAVLALTTAPPPLGGAGALLVLLRA